MPYWSKPILMRRPALMPCVFWPVGKVGGLGPGELVLQWEDRCHAARARCIASSRLSVTMLDLLVGAGVLSGQYRRVHGSLLADSI